MFHHKTNQRDDVTHDVIRGLRVTQNTC